MEKKFITQKEVVLQPPSTTEMMNVSKLKSWACLSFYRFKKASDTTDHDPSDPSYDPSNDPSHPSYDPSHPTKLELFCRKLYSIFCKNGMAPECIPYISPDCHGPLGRAFFNVEKKTFIKKGEKLQLLVYVVPTTDPQSSPFDMIDRLCEEMGIISQCCLAEAILDKNKINRSSYVKQVANSIKDKLQIQCEKGKVIRELPMELPAGLIGSTTIVFGRDVTYHGKSKYHIDGIVASMDNLPQITKFKGLVSLRNDKEGITQDGERMIGELLISFEKSVGTLPDKMIFYRDGVGQGPFNEVHRQEINSIKKACRSIIKKGRMPTITFITVKNYHPNRSNNMCTEVGIQRTRRPTHYYTLYDENGFTSNTLKQLTNSYAYSPSSSVSVVAPIYYAHHVAFRARQFVEPTPNITGKDGMPVLMINEMASDNLMFYL